MFHSFDPGTLLGGGAVIGTVTLPPPAAAPKIPASPWSVLPAEPELKAPLFCLLRNTSDGSLQIRTSDAQGLKEMLS